MKLMAMMPALPLPQKSMTGVLTSESNAAFICFLFFFCHCGIMHNEFAPVRSDN
jgi:hypothetical protein